MLRILHVNKFAHIVGGVETHVRDLMELQAARGHTVDLFSVSDVPGAGFDAGAASIRAKITSAATLLWSLPAERALSTRVAAFRPDVVHFHGIYHQLSPSVLRSPRKVGAASVITLHDYKLAAPCYLLFRDEDECTLCVGKAVPVDAVRYRCVKGSLGGSALCAAEQAVHRVPYQRGIDAYIVPSEDTRARVGQAGAVDASRVHVVPHGLVVPDVAADLETSSKRIVFFGRLAPEKGVTCLLKAWALTQLDDDWELVIAGDGAEREQLEGLGVERARFVGQMDSDELNQTLRSAAAVVVPSLFPETFGLSAAEAMAHGLPTLVSDRGNLPALAGNAELVVRANDPVAWAKAIDHVASTPDFRKRVGPASRRRIQSEFSVSAALDGTDAVYETALAAVGRRRGRT